MSVNTDLGPGQEIETALAELTAKKTEWAQLPLARKIALLEAVHDRWINKMVSLGRAGAEVKGAADEASATMEMLGSVALPAVYINKLLRTLKSIKATGKAPELPSRTTSSGQKAVKVFPLTWCDRNDMLQPGVNVELVLQPEEETVRQGEVYDKEGNIVGHKGRLCVVLGAGNHGFLALKDALVCLYERGEVVALKPHPLMAPWQQVADHVMQPLREAGYYRTLYLATPDLAGQLLHHRAVDCVHMTGGTATHDAIVWGATREEQQRRRQENDPLLKVPITSELGCVTPWLVAPWRFSCAQMAAQARALVLAMTANAGCNCNSAKVLVLPGDWEQAEEFLQAVRKILKETPQEPPYYPGIRERYEAFKAAYPNCEVIEAPARPTSRPMGPPLPYLLNIMQQLPEDPKSEYAFNVEPFAPVLTVVRLPTKGAADFLTAAPRFANESLWGSLSCSLVLHPGLEKAHPQEAEKAISQLRYGLVAINTWAGMSFVVGSCTWGAFAGGQTTADVGSGLGLMANPYLVEGVQKALFRAPMTGAAVPQPPHLQPMPMCMAKLAVGFVVGGVKGAVQALRSAA